MSTKIEPLVSDEDLLYKEQMYTYPTSREVRRAINWMRAIYEADRATDLAKITTLEAQITAMREAGQRLVKQANLCTFIDDHGHDLRTNAAYLDIAAWAAATTPDQQPPTT